MVRRITLFYLFILSVVTFLSWQLWSGENQARSIVDTLFAGASILGIAFAALLGLGAMPMAVAELRSVFLPTSWIAWVRPTGLVVNMRSYQDRCVTGDDCLVELDYHEIAEVHPDTEILRVPVGGLFGYHSGLRCRTETIESLVIRLRDPPRAALVEIFSINARRMQPPSKYSRLRIRPQRMAHRVSLLSATEIRLIWAMLGSQTAPKLEKVLEVLRYFVSIGTAQVRDVPNVDIDNQISLLAASGLPEEAAKMLCRHRGMEPREAWKVACQLTRSPPS
ncbi:MAG TPA: hypothetical protein VMF30_13380 [Pirellulales bacterium]|nr:hypothetical protein [Pirellulales bacterium]